MAATTTRKPRKRRSKQQMQVEDALDFYAIFVIGDPDKHFLTVRRSKTPQKRLTVGNAACPLDLKIWRLFWVRGDKVAVRLEKSVKEVLDDIGYPKASGNWYRIKEKLLTDLIKVMAKEAGITLYTETQKARELRLFLDMTESRQL